MNDPAVLFYSVIAAVCLLLFLIALVFGLIHRSKWVRLRKISHMDAASGLCTEAGFLILWGQGLQTQANKLSLVSMQIRGLSRLRSVLGSEAYGTMLRNIAAALTGQVGTVDPIARTGEDSFCFLLRVRNQDAVQIKLSAIHQSISSVGDNSLFHFSLDPVFGVYLPEQEESVTDPLGKAAAARPAPDDKQTVCFLDRSLQQRADRGREAVEALHSAMARREFQVFYQPKVRLADHKVIGLEALLRWRHPQQGILTPDMFLPLLERYEALPPLDRFVWEEVCRLLARWKREGRELCPISLNLSAADLANEATTGQLYALCRQYDVNPAFVELECKERHLLHNPDRAKAGIDELRHFGFRFAMDNFGADHTSLTLLATLEPDVVKLDRSFFSGSNNDRRGRVILDSLLKLSAQLHISTVAEGVESLPQIQYLQQVACDSVQGFYFRKAISPDRLTEEIFDGKELRTLDPAISTSQLPTTPAEPKFDQEQMLSRSIVLFTYWPGQDLVEFSDSFSPLLEGNTHFDRALAFLRTSGLIYENDKQDFFALLERSESVAGWVENTLRFCGADGHYEWMELRLKREFHGNDVRISGMLVNMARWRSELNRWKEKATRDTMTGVYNKEYFEQAARKSLENPNYSCAAILFIDIDDFKQANDTFGHVFGDDVLQHLSKQLLSIFRHNDIIARYGGDEFTVFAPSMEPEVLQDRLNRLYQAFRFPYRSENKEFRIAVSIGAAFYGTDGTTYEELLDHADCAVYEAKERGKNQFVFYESHMKGEKGAADTDATNTD